MVTGKDPGLCAEAYSRRPLDSGHQYVHIHVMAKETDTSEERSAVDLTACTCANLRRAARMVTQVYDKALHPAGLKATQFTLLATLSKREDLPLTRLAEALVMDLHGRDAEPEASRWQGKCPCRSA